MTKPNQPSPPYAHCQRSPGKPLREAFQSKKQRNLGIRHLGGGVVKKSKKSQVSVGKSSKLGGGSSEIKKVPSSREYQRLKNNDSFSSYEDPKT